MNVEKSKSMEGLDDIILGSCADFSYIFKNESKEQLLKLGNVGIIGFLFWFLFGLVLHFLLFVACWTCPVLIFIY